MERIGAHSHIRGLICPNNNAHFRVFYYASFLLQVLAWTMLSSPERFHKEWLDKHLLAEHVVLFLK